jgi:hypothetical protein
MFHIEGLILRTTAVWSRQNFPAYGSICSFEPSDPTDLSMRMTPSLQAEYEVGMQST